VPGALVVVVEVVGVVVVVVVVVGLVVVVVEVVGLVVGDVVGVVGVGDVVVVLLEVFRIKTSRCPLPPQLLSNMTNCPLGSADALGVSPYPFVLGQWD
jgi:hypothetical protein